MKKGPSNIQDLYLEQAAVGELEQSVMQRVLVDSGCTQECFDTTVDQLRETNRYFHEHVSTNDMLANIRKIAFKDKLTKQRIASVVLNVHDERLVTSEYNLRTETSKRHFLRWKTGKRKLGLLSLAAFAIPLLIFFVGGISNGLLINQSTTGMGFTRAKGLESRIFIYRDLGNDETELLSNENVVMAGDRLQISYLVLNEMYGIIFSIDGNGQVTLHHPNNDNMMPRLELSREVYLSYGYQLDDALSFESFFFITSQSPFDVRNFLALLGPQIKSDSWLKDGNLTFSKNFTTYRIDLLKPVGGQDAE